MKKLVFWCLIFMCYSFAQTDWPVSPKENVQAGQITYQNYLLKMSTGSFGSVFESGTTTVNGNFYALQVVSECVIDSLVDRGMSGDTMNGVTLGTGTVIFSSGITKVKLTSGSVLLYKRE